MILLEVLDKIIIVPLTSFLPSFGVDASISKPINKYSLFQIWSNLSTESEENRSFKKDSCKFTAINEKIRKNASKNVLHDKRHLPSNLY